MKDAIVLSRLPPHSLRFTRPWRMLRTQYPNSAGDAHLRGRRPRDNSHSFCGSFELFPLFLLSDTLYFMRSYLLSCFKLWWIFMDERDSSLRFHLLKEFENCIGIYIMLHYFFYLLYNDFYLCSLNFMINMNTIFKIKIIIKNNSKITKYR